MMSAPFADDYRKWMFLSCLKYLLYGNLKIVSLTVLLDCNVTFTNQLETIIKDIQLD